MKDFEQQKTTSCGLKGRRSQYNLKKLPPAAHISYKPEMVGSRFGWVTVISPEKRWSQRWNHCYVLTKCEGCGSIQWQDFNQLQRGKSKGCQACSQKRKIPVWLEKRLAAAKSRCENPRDPEFKNYGARGIKFCFPSVIEAGLYLEALYPHISRTLEIDRIDTNGNYEPGNIRFASHKQNQANKRNTVLSEFSQEYWPYCRNVVVRRLSQGYTREQIIQQAEESVNRKCKGWKLISARLDFMTYEMPGHITVLPYRES